MIGLYLSVYRCKMFDITREDISLLKIGEKYVTIMDFIILKSMYDIIGWEKTSSRHFLLSLS